MGAAEDIRRDGGVVWDEGDVSFRDHLRSPSAADNHCRVRMYKQRLKEWKIWKSLSQDAVRTMLMIKAEREKVGKQSAFVLGNRAVDWDDVERIRKRHHIDISGVDHTACKTIPDLVVYTPLPLSSSETSSPVLTPVSTSNTRSPSPESLPLVLTPSDTLTVSPAPLLLVRTPSSSSSASSAYSVPMTMALPSTLAYRERFMRGVKDAFTWMITSGYWKLSRDPEMPWNPAPLHAATSNNKVALADWYYQDECVRHLINGVDCYEKQDIATAGKEWNEAFSMISNVVKARHYNTLIKLLDGIRTLDRKNLRDLSDMFRKQVCMMVHKVLGEAHPYYPVFLALFQLPADDIDYVMTHTLAILVDGLERRLGEGAFTAFEHKMVLASKQLDANPSEPLDARMPTDAECSFIHGPTSSKTFLMLNMRCGLLRNRGQLMEAQDVCRVIVGRAVMVEDGAVSLWHLANAWVQLGYVQYDMGDLNQMRLSLQNAWVAEHELRNTYGIVKLGAGELNWILERMGEAPRFEAPESMETALQELRVYEEEVYD